ncbi:MAG: nucleoside deaminase [Bacillota bacterium]|nr:nucleoside deaminase [Bacillota bacterium]
MWTRVGAYWQEAMRLAWDSFLAGTVPVGCVIVDVQGEIISRGRNAIFGSITSSPLDGTNLAHAEMNALYQLKRDDHPQIRQYTLYTSLEPCPMCFGAAVMMGIRQIRYGARDAIAGSAALRSATPYLRSKKVRVELADPSLEVFQLALVTAFELQRKHRRQAEFLALLRGDCPLGAAIGTELFGQGYFDRARQANYTVQQVYDQIMDAAKKRSMNENLGGIG